MANHDISTWNDGLNRRTTDHWLAVPTAGCHLDLGQWRSSGSQMPERWLGERQEWDRIMVISILLVFWLGQNVFTHFVIICTKRIWWKCSHCVFFVCEYEFQCEPNACNMFVLAVAVSTKADSKRSVGHMRTQLLQIGQHKNLFSLRSVFFLTVQFPDEIHRSL